METNSPFTEQVRLLVTLLPHVARQDCFALKGGTAINLFVRNLPRLSVDIDLAYLPVEDRETSLAAIDCALQAIAGDITRAIPRVKVYGKVLGGTAKWFKFVVDRDGVTVKIEVTPVIRGSVYSSQRREITSKAQAMFGYAQVQTLSFEDLYAGKLCAALDRQHPRDLFDVQLLLETEGITSRLKDAFLVYLLSHNRSMTELLAPRRKEIETVFQGEFSRMAIEPISQESLEATREELIAAVHRILTEEDRQFLLAVKRGDADWSQFPIADARRLPSVQWKLHNLSRMDPLKRQKALNALERALYG
ncbi:nucleotidyl transferase AbiEii/AbiGii toxin family protein [uncultured Nitrospira sp.]|uniref:nucleotidyl transferase AbiEii/AbiGii toxin family protein n=1 Tax=uncultured Nitrospira sp. TaxID=157176 RepID=UPI003140C772